MTTQELLYLRFHGRTASYRIPTTITGAQLSLEIPGYSSIIGLLSVMLGRKYDPTGKGIGIRYTYEAQNLDLETTHRWERDSKSGRIKYNHTNPRKRQVHYNPTLELFLTDLSLEPDIKYPKRTPTLGRSQDLAKLDVVKRVQAKPVTEGKVTSTLIPINMNNTMKTISQNNNVLLQETITQGVLYVLPTDFDVSELGRIRQPLNFSMFLTIPREGNVIKIQKQDKPVLLKVSKKDLDPPVNYPWNDEEPVIFMFYYT